MMERQTSFITKWVYGMIRSSLIWLFFNLPIGYLVLNLLLAENFNEFATLMTTIYVLIPFVFSPGTVVALDCTRRFYREGSAYPLWKTAWKSYRKNWLISMKQGLIFCGGIFVLLAASRFYGQYFGGAGQMIPYFAMGILSLLFLFVLAYTADREETLVDYWKKSGLLIINHFLLFVFMSLEVLLTIYFTHFFSFLLIFVAPGLVLLFVMHFYLETVKSEAFRDLKP